MNPDSTNNGTTETTPQQYSAFQFGIDSVFKYIGEWQKMTQRIGFWVDFDSAYVTFHKSYVESVWWALSEMFNKGLLYQGYKVVWWWPQGGTALSVGEVGQGSGRIGQVERGVTGHPLARPAAHVQFSI